MLLPTSLDVARLLREFTTPRVTLGAEETASEDTGDFTTTTTPTKSVVDALIDRASRIVYASVGSNAEADLSDTLMREAVAELITTYTAAEVARRYQQDAYEALREQFTTDLRLVSEGVRESRAGSGPDAGVSFEPGVSYECLPDALEDW